MKITLQKTSEIANDVLWTKLIFEMKLFVSLIFTLRQNMGNLMYLEL